MEIFYKLKPLEKDSCVALGFFDGVHLGHQAVINNAIRMAKENKMASIVFTFSEKPNSRSNETITTNAQKAVIFKKYDPLFKTNCLLFFRHRKF